jgi:hypothetical protein
MAFAIAGIGPAAARRSRHDRAPDGRREVAASRSAARRARPPRGDDLGGWRLAALEGLRPHRGEIRRRRAFGLVTRETSLIVSSVEDYVRHRSTSGELADAYARLLAGPCSRPTGTPLERIVQRRQKPAESVSGRAGSARLEGAQPGAPRVRACGTPRSETGAAPG